MKTPCAGPTPEVRRWTHPIEVKPPQDGVQCGAMQTVLCALAGQNQVLCAIKAELDEVYALLRAAGEGGALPPPAVPDTAGADGETAGNR